MGSDSRWGHEDPIEKLLEESYEMRMKSHSSRSSATVGNDNNNENNGPDRYGRRLVRLASGFSTMEMLNDCNSSMGDKATVLYMDYNGFLSPISKAYYSQDSKSVVSSHPLSLRREAEVMYCPQLCGFYCVETEAHACKGRCPRCYGCPVCGTALSVSSTCLEAQQSIATEKVRGGGISQGLVSQDKETLVKTLASDEARDLCTNVLNSLIIGIRSQAVASSKVAREGRRMCIRSDGGGQGRLRKELESGGNHNNSYNSDINCAASGSIESLYEDFIKRKAVMNSERESLANVGLLAEDAPPLYAQQSKGGPDDDSGLGTAVKNTLNDNSIGSSEDMNVLEVSTLPSLKMRLGQMNSTRNEIKLLSLKPQRLPLRVKCAKRCIKDVNVGRTGLLVKPKANPEEGDSTGDRAGQWFKKDYSALYSIPEITLVPPIELDSIVLCITNPLDSPLTIHLMETSPLPDISLIQPVRLLRCEINTIVKLSAKEDDLLLSTAGVAIGSNVEEEPRASGDGAIDRKCPGTLRSKGNTTWVRIPVKQYCSVDGENIVEGKISGVILAVALDMHVKPEEDDNNCDAVHSTIIAWES